MKNLKVIVDQGHVKDYNQGVIHSYHEGTQMYVYGKHVVDEFKKNGITALSTRNNVNENPTLTERGRKAINTNADIFISEHTNACNDSSVDRICVIYSVKRPQSKALAILIGSELANLFRSKLKKSVSYSVYTRKASDGDDYYGVIRSSVLSPRVKFSYIIEHSFHTNIEACKLLNDDKFLKEMAECETQTIIKYFKVLDVDDEDDISEKHDGVSKTSIELYRVRKSKCDSKSQIGAFESLENAIKASKSNVGYKVYDNDGRQIYPSINKTSTKKSKSSATIKVGAYVKIKQSAKYWSDRYGKQSTKAIPTWAKGKEYNVSQISNNSVLLDKIGICSWICKEDIELV